MPLSDLGPKSAMRTTPCIASGLWPWPWPDSSLAWCSVAAFTLSTWKMNIVGAANFTLAYRQLLLTRKRCLAVRFEDMALTTANVAICVQSLWIHDM